MPKIVIPIVLILLFISQPISAQNVQSSDTVMVLPFENISDKPEFNWVGESFAAALTDLLKLPSLNVVDNDERKIIQQRLKVPLTTLPSLATSLKLAREGKSTLLIAGRYNIIPAQGDIAASISVTARIIRVNEGRFLNEELPDGRRLTRDINLIDALENLQTVEGQLAYQIMYQRDKSTLAFSQNDFVKQATKVPAKAFEAYVKGLLTSEKDSQTREAFFKNAMIRYSEAKTEEGASDESAKIYADAALELGHFYLNQKQLQTAVEYFSKVPNSDSHFPEAAFYIGVIYWQQKNYEQALAVLTPLADDLKLNSVYNTLGAIAVEASRSEKRDKVKAAARLNQGVEFLKKASESDPDDPESLFNYSIGLFLSNNYTETVKQVRPVLAINPRDGEAYYLLAKALEKNNDPTAGDFDNQSRRFLSNYAKLETDWQKSKTIEGISLRVVQPPRRDFVGVILLSKQNKSVVQKPVDETASLLEQAQKFYQAGRDDDSMQVLRRIISSDPINGKAYLLIGKIHLRRGDLDQAVSSLKTSLFWDNRLIDAHIALGKIFIEKKDCQQAKNYAVSAIQIDENNQEAQGLQRQVERCSK